MNMEKNLVLRNFGIAPHCVSFFFRRFAENSTNSKNNTFAEQLLPESSCERAFPKQVPPSSILISSTQHLLHLLHHPHHLNQLHLHHIYNFHVLHLYIIYTYITYIIYIIYINFSYILHRSHLGVNPLRRSCVSDAQALSEMRIFSGAASPFRTK